jgi:hypothetical protein
MVSDHQTFSGAEEMTIHDCLGGGLEALNGPPVVFRYWGSEASTHRALHL